MNLKFRLTLFNTMIAGGLLLLFSAAIYGLVTITLIAQIDEQLESVWAAVRQVTRVSSQGELETITEISFDRSIFIQFWDRNGNLEATSYSVNQLQESLNPADLNSPVPVFSDNYLVGVHLRVLSVPLRVGERSLGTMQIGTSMDVVDRTQQELLSLIGLSLFIAIALAAVFNWLSTQSSLRSLENARNAAQLIMQTNDLSRRIPMSNNSDDEVAQFVSAFNQNLSRIERLLETQRRFIADVGHELRTPLTVIKGNVGLMRRMREFDEESLVGISDEVDRLTRLVGDLILLAQAEAGKLPMGWDPVDLTTVLLEVYKQMQVLAADKKMKLSIELIDPLMVCGDRDRLTQVLVNLISNAIKYTPSGGTVKLYLRKEEQKAVFEVKDSGPGIPEADLPYIFERFFRAEKSRHRSKDGKGFGLGLSIAYYIVTGHQGTIQVDSKVGNGTTFSVSLPATEGDCSRSE